MSGGTVALMSGGTYDSGTKVVASTEMLKVLSKSIHFQKYNKSVG